MTIDEITNIAESYARAFPIDLYMLANQPELAAEVDSSVVRPERIAVKPDEASVNPDSGVVELTSENIEKIHQKLVEIYTGDDRIIARGTFENVSISPYEEMYGSVLYPSIFDKAAKYLYSFATLQVFADGNKRTSIITPITFLAINGYRFTMPEGELEKFVMSVVDHELESIEEIAAVFEANTEPV